MTSLELVDLRALLRIASAAELTRARQALTLIAARGYDRGRDLIPELQALLPPGGPFPMDPREPPDA